MKIFYIISVVIQYYIERCLCLSSTLSFTYRTFHQVFGICSGTIYFVKNLMFFESVDSWKLMLLWLGCGTEFCYFQNTGSISLVSKVLLFILFTVFFLILLLPMSSLRFLWRLKAVTGSFWKTFFRDSLTDSMFQFFRIILLMFGKSRLYVIVKGMRAVIDVSFLLPLCYLLLPFLLPFVTIKFLNCFNVLVQ